MTTKKPRQKKIRFPVPAITEGCLKGLTAAHCFIAGDALNAVIDAADTFDVPTAQVAERLLIEGARLDPAWAKKRDAQKLARLRPGGSFFAPFKNTMNVPKTRKP